MFATAPATMCARLKVAWEPTVLLAAVLGTGCGEAPTGASELSPPPIASISITPSSVVMLEGERLQLVATLHDSTGVQLAGRIVTWWSLNADVARVTPAGLVEAIGLGVVPVVAYSGGHVDTALIDVRVLFQSVSAGARHACGVTMKDSGYCWGAGGVGRLGNGSTRTRTRPVRVRRGLNFRQLSAGRQFTCGLAGGGAYCWGSNRSGQLGSGAKDDTWAPVRVVGDERFGLVAAYAVHACAVTVESLDAVCWGSDWTGQVGDGPRLRGLGPESVVGGLQFISLDTGWLFTCGVATDGRAYCWGENDLGQLGRPDVEERCIDPFGVEVPCSTAPVPVSGAVTFQSVATGTKHACAVTSEGRAYCWGVNAYGQLGDGSTAGATSPVQVVGGHSFALLAAGDQHTCGLTVDGTAYCWGDNTSGALGTSATFDSCSGYLCSTTPVAVSGGFKFRSLSVSRGAGGAHTCGVTVTNEAYCWGRNDSGQLGHGYRGGISFSPVRVAGQP